MTEPTDPNGNGETVVAADAETAKFLGPQAQWPTEEEIMATARTAPVGSRMQYRALCTLGFRAGLAQGRTDERSAQAGEVATLRERIYDLEVRAEHVRREHEETIGYRQHAEQQLAEANARIADLERKLVAALERGTEYARELVAIGAECETQEVGTMAEHMHHLETQVAAYEPVVRAALWGSVETVRAAAECIPAELRPGEE